MKKIKQSKGITIVALVVTITVLLILAGISIATLRGENGLIKKTKNSKMQTEIAEEKEILELATIKSMEKDQNGSISKTNIDEELNNAVGSNNYISKQISKGILITFKNERKYIIDNDGNVKTVTERTGMQVGDYINYEPDEVSDGYSSANLTQSLTGSTNNTNDITQETLNWQILKIYEDGSMDLIGSPTTQKITQY